MNKKESKRQIWKCINCDWDYWLIRQYTDLQGNRQYLEPNPICMGCKAYLEPATDEEYNEHVKKYS